MVYALLNHFEIGKGALLLPKAGHAFSAVATQLHLIYFSLTGSVIVKDDTKAKGELLRHY